MRYYRVQCKVLIGIIFTKGELKLSASVIIIDLHTFSGIAKFGHFHIQLLPALKDSDIIWSLNIKILTLDILEIPVLIRSLKSSNFELGKYLDGTHLPAGCFKKRVMRYLRLFHSPSVKILLNLALKAVRF